MNRELVGRIIGAVLVALVAFAVPYLLVSFIVMDFNPANWEQYERAVMGSAGFFIIALWARYKRG